MKKIKSRKLKISSNDTDDLLTLHFRIKNCQQRVQKHEIKSIKKIDDENNDENDTDCMF